MKKIFLLIVFIFTELGFAQSGSSGTVDTRSMGLAKTYVSNSSGVYAIGINPANLVLSEENSFEFSTLLPLPFVSIKTGTDFLSIDDFNYFFGGVGGKSRYLNDNDKVRLNNLFKDGGLIFFDLSANIISLSYNSYPQLGAFAFSINDFFAGSFNFPEAVVDFALTGNPLGKVYNFDDAELKAWWIRKYSFSYAREFPELNQKLFDKIAAGFTVKLVHGYMYAGTERVNTSLQTGASNEVTGNADLSAFSAFSDDFGIKYDFDSLDRNSNAGPFPGPAGTGIGFDIGVSAQFEDNWIFALALTDIGSISWDKNTAEFSALGDIYLDDVTNKDQLDSLKDKLKGEGKRTGAFSTSMPTAFRLGVSRFFPPGGDVPGSLLLSFDYNQGFNDMPGNSTTPRISVSAEWKPGNWIPFIRTGLSFGGLDGFNWGFGLGMDAGIVEFNFATSDFQTLIAPNSADQISFAFGSRWRF